MHLMKSYSSIKSLLQMPEEGSCVHIAMGPLRVYGTMIRGCGVVVDTIYQVVNSTSVDRYKILSSGWDNAFYLN